MELVEALDRRFYPGVKPNWDDALLFEQTTGRLAKAARLLDVGAGAGIVRQLDFRSFPVRVHGCDLDPRVSSNPLVQYACLADAEWLPYRSGVFDVVVADNLLEHLRRPERVFAEIARVLRPGGWFHFKTPNRRHYVPAVARLTPHWIHQRVAARRGRREADTFETHYRANTFGAIRKLARGAKLEVEEIRFVENRPEYCRIHPGLYVLGIAYERLVNLSDSFAAFRVVIVGTLRKGTT